VTFCIESAGKVPTSAGFSASPLTAPRTPPYIRRIAAIVIENCSVVDGMGNPPQPGVDVVVEGNRIAKVEPTGGNGGAPASVQETRIDGTGKTVMPGLIDAHTHMTYGESMTQEEQDIFTSVEGRTLRAAWNVQKVLAAGVTGLSQPGGSYFIGVAVRDGIAEKRIKGPRMTAAGRYITTSNGLTDWYPDDTGAVEGSIGIRCNTIDEMIVEVRRQVKNGVDFIKLADSPNGEYQSFRDEELKAVADLSHQLKKRCTIHARGDAEVNAAARAGFDWIMHGNQMTQETVDLLAETQIPLVPTILLLEIWAVYGPSIGSPRPIVEGCRRMLERTKESLHMAHEAGVKFVMGTDTGFAMTPYGEWHAKELELLMKYAGMTELEAIQAATYNAGITLSLEGEVGAVAPGMLADLLVVDGDPSEDITVLQDRARIEEIIVDGEIMDVDRQLETWPNHSSFTYTNRYLTQEVARGMDNGSAPLPPVSTSINPIAE
jgi:imidazolonepropionase-like amidohydrolase